MLKKIIVWAHLLRSKLCGTDIDTLGRAAKILKLARAHDAVTLIDQAGERLELRQ